MFSKREWSFVRSASLAKRGASKDRLSPLLHKFPSWRNKVTPRIFQTALVQKEQYKICPYGEVRHYPKVLKGEM
jgi:hypothetical protein